jgi:hypothetical protein
MRTPPPIPRLVPERVAAWRERAPGAIDPTMAAVIEELVRGPSETRVLCERVAAPRLAIQERVVVLLRAHLFDTPRGAEQERLRQGPHALATETTAIDLALRERLLATTDHLERCDGLRAHLDAEEARHRNDELFATRAAFAIPERDPIDQTARFMATWRRVEQRLGGVPLPPRPAGPVPDDRDLALAVASAHLEAGAGGGGSSDARRDLVALFLCDLGTLLDGRAPRPLPSWL